MMRKIYVASSWRNKHQSSVVKLLRSAGHKVCDVKNPRIDDRGFSWKEIEPDWQSWTPFQFRNNLSHPIAERGFSNDWEAMQWADTGVLLLPCGRSAHIESGHFVGAKKPLYILILEQTEPELMYKMATGICLSVDELICNLSTLE